MKGLFIDTASQKGVAILFEGGLPRLSRYFPAADGLLPELEKLLKEAGLKPKDLQFIGAGVGPGSFTGIRVGQMSARAFCYALEIPLYGLSSLAIYSRDIPVMVDARIGGVWAQFPGELPILIEPAQLVEKLNGYSLILSPEPKPLIQRFQSLSLETVVEEGRPDAMLVGDLLLEEMKKGGDGVPEILYLRKTQPEC